MLIFMQNQKLKSCTLTGKKGANREHSSKLRGKRRKKKEGKLIMLSGLGRRQRVHAYKKKLSSYASALRLFSDDDQNNKSVTNTKQLMESNGV